METLTQVQKDLIDFLKASRVEMNNIVMTLLLLKGNEAAMKRLVVFIADNKPNSDQVMEKVQELSMMTHRLN